MAGLTAWAVFLFVLFWSLDTQTWILAGFLVAPWIASGYCMLRVPRCNVELLCPPQGRIGETVALQVSLRPIPKAGLPDLVVHALGLPDGVDTEADEGIAAGALRYGESIVVRVPLQLRRRGVHRIPGVRLASDFPFGLLESSIYFLRERHIVVEPHPSRVRWATAPSGRGEDQGPVGASRISRESMESVGNRPWRHGDRPRDVDWRATARHLGSPDAALVVREWSPPTRCSIVIVVDLVRKRPSRPFWAPIPDPSRQVDQTLEASLSLAAGIIERCRRDGTPVALVIGDQIVRDGDPHQSNDRFFPLLEALARLEGEAQIAGGILDTVLRQFPGSTIVWVTNHGNSEGFANTVPGLGRQVDLRRIVVTVEELPEDAAIRRLTPDEVMETEVTL